MNENNEKGITLIMLAVTIIVILILAGVTINAIVRPNGMLYTSKEVTNKDKNQEETQTKETDSLLLDVKENLKETIKDISGANAPKLNEDMIPVKWVESPEGSSWVVTDEKDEEWYSYTDKKWANIMMRKNTAIEDTSIDVRTANLSQMKNKKIKQEGDMFVWIPRFAYQISSGHHTGGKKTQEIIKIQFLEGLTDKPLPDGISEFNNENGQNNWNIHPAFTYGEEVSGIWFAKFEVSKNNNDNIQIRPNVEMNLNNLGIDEIYQKSIQYNSNLNSHLMKNVEWGAVAYLSQSQYGSSNVAKNETQITGGINYIKNVNLGTTGNVYGVYDMNGGTNEYVAAFLDNGSLRFTNESKKNVDVYKKSNEQGKTNYDLSIEKYGDSIYETSSQGTNAYAWNQGKSEFIDDANPYFLRGGNSVASTNSGIFSFEKANGTDINSKYTFRPILIVH